MEVQADKEDGAAKIDLPLLHQHAPQVAGFFVCEMMSRLGYVIIRLF